jgi:cysteinylglycine-S-conjugate dipeptidase
MLLLGIEDPKSNAHAPNESLDAVDFQKLTLSLAHLFVNLAESHRPTRTKFSKR